MTHERRPTRAVLLVAGVLTIAIVAVAAGAGSAAATTDASTPTVDAAAETAAEETVTANYSVTYRPTDGDADGILMDVTFENPEVHRIPGVRVSVDTGGARYYVAEGGDFTEANPDEWQPKEGVDEASMTLRYEYDSSPIPVYDDSHGVVEDRAAYDFVEPGSLGLETDTTAVGTDLAVSVSESFGTETFVDSTYDTRFVGQHTNYTAQTDHGEITLVVPDGVAIPAGPQNVVDGLAELSAELDVEKRHSEIVAYPGPGDFPLGTARIADGGFWSSATAPIGAVDSTWQHEFMHVTDPVSKPKLSSDLEWFTEAYATWYESQTPMRAAYGDADYPVTDSVNYVDYQSELDEGRLYRVDLTDTSQWWGSDGSNGRAHYDQGRLTISAIDRQIRLATDGDANFDDVVAQLADQDTPGHADLLDAVEAVSGDSALRSQADAWISGEELPKTPSAQEYTDAYDYGVHAISTVDVTARGTSGGERVDLKESGTNRVDVGEQVTADLTVSNDGTATGQFEVALTADDEVLDTASLTLDPQTTETVRLAHQFTDAGAYDVEAGRMDAESTGVDVDVAAVAPDATLVHEGGSTTASSPAEVDHGSQIAVLTDGLVGNVTFEQVDGDHSVNASTGDDFEVATQDSAELEIGADYRVDIREDEDAESQYVTIVADAEPPTVEITDAPDEQVVEFAFQALASVSRGDSDDLSYHWELGDGTTADRFYVAHGYEEPGEYEMELTVTDEYGQTATDTHVVDVYARPPDVQISAPAEVQAGEQFDLVADESLGDGAIVAYDWSLGDGTTASGDAISHSYDEPGTYSAELTVTDEYGHTATASTDVDVTEADDAGVPEQTLLVDDFEDATAWSNHDNSLGRWTGGSDELDVADGVLTAPYQNHRWFETKVGTDVSEYSELAVVVRGASGGEGSDVELHVGSTSGSLAELSGDSVGTEYSTVTVDFADLDFDQSSPGGIRLTTEWGSQGTYEIEEIRFQ